MNLLVGLLLALAVLLLWWPISTDRIRLRHVSSINYHHILIALVSEIETASNFDHAFESVAGIKFEQWELANPVMSIPLRHIQKLAHASGIPSKPLIAFQLDQLNNSRKSADAWREKSAAARTASVMLLVLPVGLWFMASAMGVDAQGWLFGTEWGRVFLILGVLLNVVSTLLLRKLNQKFTHARVHEPSKVSHTKIPQVDATVVAIFVCSAIVFWFPSIVGLIVASLGYIATREIWPKLLSSRHHASHKNMLQQRPWVAMVIAASLHSGASWLDGVQSAVASCDAFIHTELEQVAQRLRWGVEPAVAFETAHELLRPISETIQRSAQTGAPVHDTLLRQAKMWQDEFQTQSIQKTVAAAERLIVPVTLLQLPAFFLLGVVPMVVAEIAPMLETFSSTATHLS